jgi:hypothetical protein
MVKNTIGGKKGKMLANKRSGSGGDRKLRLSMNDYEIYVCVSKVFGGGIFEVIDNNGVKLKAHLRGKMKGPNKRHNFVSLFSILLVGKRCDLSDSLNCDVLFVYDDQDVLALSLLPNLNIVNIISVHQNHFMNEKGSKNSNDLFSNLENNIELENDILEENVLEYMEEVDFGMI